MNIGEGYPLGRLARAFTTATRHEDPATRRRAENRVRAWTRVLDGMADGTLAIGSRTPVAGLPAWVTLQVVHGGFATGTPLAGGPLLPHESAVAANRADVFAHYLTDAGIAELNAMLDAGDYEITVPEESALLTVAWLLRDGDRTAALDVLDEIAPFADRLRFVPRRHPGRPQRDPEHVFRRSVGEVRAALLARRTPPAIDAMHEALNVWNPFADRLLTHWLTTVVDGRVAAAYPEDWAERSAALLSEYSALAAAHRLCSKHRRPKENAAILRTAMEDVLGGRTPKRGLLQHAVDSMVARRGTPGSPEHSALRERQAADAARPVHRRLAEIAADRLAALPQDDGLPDTTSFIHPVTQDEHARSLHDTPVSREDAPLPTNNRDRVPPPTPGDTPQLPAKDTPPPSGYEAATSPQTPGEAATPTQNPGEAATSVYGPGEAATPIQNSGEAATSTQNPGEAATTNYGPGEAATPAQNSGEAAVPSQNSGEVAASAQWSAEAAVPSQGPWDAHGRYLGDAPGQSLDQANGVRAGRPGVPVGTVMPDVVLRTVGQGLRAPIETLVERRIVASAEVLAGLVPQLVASTVAMDYADERLATLVSAGYRAFRKRRSLLLVNLEHQVRFEELPWVRAIESRRGSGGDAARAAARTALTRLGELTLTAFPGTIIPNRLVTELSALARQAGLDAPFVEELAADIFMDDFSPKFVRAAEIAAELLDGSLYVRYYGIDTAHLWTLRTAHGAASSDTPPKREPRTPKAGARKAHAGLTSDPERDAAREFAALCKARAGAGGGSWVAANGRVIEQSQILTTHNLAVLVGPAGVSPGPGWPELARRAFTVMCDRLLTAHRSALPLRAVKDAAYAWRQALFYLSMAGDTEARAFALWARDETDRVFGPVAARTAAPTAALDRVLAGLDHVLDGGGLDGDDGYPRRFLGWSGRWILGR
ncbi:transcriptional regulator [Spirillospora sp. NPDC049652]